MLTTIINIPATIHTIIQKNISTTIKSTFPIIPFTHSIAINNNKPPVPSTDSPTVLLTSISSDLSITNIKTKDEYSQNEIITDQNISKFESSAIDELISTAIPTLNNEETLVIFIGLNLFTMHKSFFFFNIYFIPTKNIIYSNTLIFPIIITYYTNIRSLKELQGNCTLQETNMDSKYKYLCKVEGDTSNIKQIRILPDFKFISQENITLIGITPFAKMYMDNVQLIGENFNYIDNSTIYLLDNSTYTKYDKKLFDIFGSIKDPQPIFDNEDLLVMINIESDKKYYSEVECNMTNITEHNYRLFCKANETLDGDLQSAISFINNGDILIINFGANNDSKISVDKKSISNKIYFWNKAGDNISTVIVTITIVIIIALAVTIGIMIYLKRNKKNLKFNDESSLGKLKINSIYDLKNI